MGDAYDINDVSYRLSAGVTEAVGVAGAGVSVPDREGDLQFITATSELVAQIEHVRAQTQNGLCVTAFHSQDRVAVEDLSLTSDWPEYADTAMGLGVRAIVGQPLSANHTRLCALNFYDSGPRKWAEDGLDVIQVFSDMATAILLRGSELAATKRVVQQLETALTSRIEQAKWLLAGEHGISVDEAFSLLRNHSQSNNIKLEVCRAVVEERITIGP